MAPRLKLPESDSRDVDPCQLFSRWRNEEEDACWLMILDNADNVDLVFPRVESVVPETANDTRDALIDFLPKRLGAQRYLLVTTRSRHMGEDLAEGGEYIAVQPFSPEEAERLLKSKMKKWDVRPFDTYHSARLLGLLACIPLTIAQAAAFINQTTMPIQQYLTALEEHETNLKDFLTKELQDPRRQRGFPNSVFRTWKLSFDQILAQGPLAGKLLSLIAMLDRQHIPKNLLQSSTERQVDFEMALGMLEGFALITKELETEAFTLHPLVQASIQYWLEETQNRYKTAQEALELLERKFPSDCYYEEYGSECELLFPHAQTVLYHSRLSENLTVRLASLSCSLAWFESWKGKYDAALQSVSEVYSVHQAVSAELARETLRSLGLPEVLLSRQGKFGAAEEVLRRALDGYDKASIPNDEERMNCIGHLADALKSQGKFKEAENLCRTALDEVQDCPGNENLHTLGLISRLASVLRKQIKFKEAEQLARRAVEGRKRILGVQNRNILNSFDDLALILGAQGEYEEAERLFQQVIEDIEKTLGPEHPESLTAANNLALVIQGQGQYKAAEEPLRHVSGGIEVVLGLEHPSTLNIVHSLAATLHGQKFFVEAETLYR